MSLYNIRAAGDAFSISKFDDDLNFEASYVTTLATCTCPAGPRPTCRHRKMLGRMMNHLGDGWFYNYKTQKWHRPVEEPAELKLANAATSLPTATPEPPSSTVEPRPLKAEVEGSSPSAAATPAPAVQGIRRRV